MNNAMINNSIQNNTFVILQTGELYYNNNYNLSFLCNLYNMTNQSFSVTNNQIVLNTTKPISMDTNTSINTTSMNYIIATEGIYPSRP